MKFGQPVRGRADIAHNATRRRGQTGNCEVPRQVPTVAALPVNRSAKVMKFKWRAEAAASKA